MKIELHELPALVKIEDFAAQYDLTMEVRQTSRSGAFSWSAQFKGADVLERRMLSGASGRGASQEAAIQDYARHISGKTLVWNAYDDRKRREIRVPELVLEPPSNLLTTSAGGTGSPWSGGQFPPVVFL